MPAEDHLNDVQFMNPHKLAAKYWDPNLKDPETFRKWTGPGYVSNLASEIESEGIKHPIQLARPSDAPGHQSHPFIYDGHHRVLAAMDLGMKKVPYRWVSGKPGEQ